MVRRTGRCGSFWGCTRYPQCRGTQPLIKIEHEGQPCRYCGTPVIRQAHAKPPAPKPGGSGRKYYFAWWFRCPACKAIYLVEAARRFFDEARTTEPSSAQDFLPDWVTREQTTLPWQ